MKDWLKKNASMILTFLGAGGVVTTAVLAARAAPKANNAIEDAKELQEEKQEPPLSKWDIVQAAAPAYIPAAAAGIGTLICIFGANMLSRKQQAALISAYAALENAYQTYRKKADQLCGVGTDHAIVNAMAEEALDRDADAPPWDEIQTFYIRDCEKPQFFERTMEQVTRAEYLLNRYFILNGTATLNDFLELLDLPPTQEGEIIGWDEYIGETLYGYRWIDFEHRHYLTDDGLMVCSIEMPFGPHSLDENAEE